MNMVESKTTEVMEQYQRIYAMLEDDESKDIYLNRLNYLISGDFKYMKHIIDKYVRRAGETTVEEWIASLPVEKPIILYGAGNDALICLPYFEKDLRFIGFCDEDEDKQKSGFKGNRVFKPDRNLFLGEETVVITSHTYKREIREFLLKNGVRKERIFDAHPQLVEYREGQYFNPDFMTFEQEEVFVDVGSYNLATVKELENCCKRIKKVYAFEPDSQNRKVCMKNKKRFQEKMIEILPYGAWSERATLSFAVNNSQSHVAEAGTMSIEAIPIDDVVDASDRITFIKMDIEGAEMEALKGAEKTILRDKPKLAICIYHKPEDMLTLPWYIKSLVPEYKLYLRHHSITAGETVLCAMP